MHAPGLLALPAADRLVADPLPLLEAPVSLALYAGVVHKVVLAALVGRDDPAALLLGVLRSDPPAKRITILPNANQSTDSNSQPVGVALLGV